MPVVLRGRSFWDNSVLIYITSRSAVPVQVRSAIVVMGGDVGAARVVCRWLVGLALQNSPMPVGA